MLIPKVMIIKLPRKPPSWIGKRHTEESKLKIGAAIRGKKRTAEQCKNISLGLQRRKDMLDGLVILN